MKGKRNLRMYTVLTLALAVMLPMTSSISSARADGSTPLTVMTRNLYFGTELSPLLAAQSPEALVEQVGRVYALMEHSMVNQRMKAIADEILARSPDVVGLQEVELYLSQFDPYGPPTVEVDLLASLLSALHGQYLLASVSPNATVSAMRMVSQNEKGEFSRCDFLEGEACLPQFLTLVDRDVLLVRSDVSYDPGSADNGSFGYALQFPLGETGMVVALPRGWTAITLEVNGMPVRVLNTHLEAFDPNSCACRRWNCSVSCPRIYRWCSLGTSPPDPSRLAGPGGVAPRVGATTAEGRITRCLVGSYG